MMMMMTFITRMGEGQGRTKKGRKATKSEGSGLITGAMCNRPLCDNNNACPRRHHFPTATSTAATRRGEDSIYQKTELGKGTRPIQCTKEEYPTFLFRPRRDWIKDRRPRPARVDTPGSKLCPNIASIKQRTSRNQKSKEEVVEKNWEEEKEEEDFNLERSSARRFLTRRHQHMRGGKGIGSQTARQVLTKWDQLASELQHRHLEGGLGVATT